MTGFRVVFDCTVSSFAIARRRMVVPIHKKWEASGARLQLVTQNKTIQLLAFFGGDFSHGKCMNFLLRGTDNYESSSRSGKCTVRIVDAKFALPKKEEEEASAFVCLDMLEYATEHDDITIGFESEQGKGLQMNMSTTHANDAQTAANSSNIFQAPHESLREWRPCAGRRCSNAMN